MLRDLIGGRTTNGDANRLALVQRVTLLENPAPETVRFMRDRFDVSRASGDLHMELASAHALGSLAGRSSSETREESRAAVRALDEAMHDAKSSEERAGLLHALGNMGDGDHVHAIAANSKDEDEDVRMAVAAALRKTPTEEAQSTLLALASDPSAGVERAALDSLGQQPLGDEARAALGELLANGALSPDSEPQAVTVLLGGGPMTADVGRVLRALMARTADKRLQARLRMLLANALPG
jgi:HEAT repeat protein